MKVFFSVCMVMGLSMILFDELYIQKQKTLDANPLITTHGKTQRIAWVRYACIVALAGGVAVLVMDKKKPGINRVQ